MNTVKEKLKAFKKKRQLKRRGNVKKILSTIKKKGITSIEEKMRNILISLELPFTREAKIKSLHKNKYFDFYVCLQRNERIMYEFFIECHGSYWHPMIFNEDGSEKLSVKRSRLTDLQKKNIINDKRKMRLAEKIGVPLLIFYENDIMKNSIKVIKRIKKEVKNQLKKNKGEYIESF